MRSVPRLALLIVAIVTLLACPPVAAQALREYTAPLEAAKEASPEPKPSPAQGQPPQELAQKDEGPPEKPAEALKKEMAKYRQEAAEKIQDFATRTDRLLKGLAEQRTRGWVAFGVMAGVGLIALLWGWALIQSLLVPFAPVWGLATGGATAFFIIKALYTDRPVWFRLTLFGVGVTLGLGLYLFAALRAKPVAAFLVILSPFLIVSAFVFDYNTVMGIVIFCAGFAAGFAAMIEVRPLAIISTSMFGACGLLGAWGMLAYLLTSQAHFLQASFQWVIQSPLTLLVAWGLLVFIGMNFQFTAGPRGTLED